MKRIAALVLLLSVSAFASGDVEVDILPRTVNFLIFAGLVYYLLANPIKNFFSGRKAGIADSFEKIQERLKSAKASKEDAASKVEEARAKAEEILNTTRAEAEILEKRIAHLKVLHKQKEESMEVSRNKMIRQVVSETMEEILESKDVSVDNGTILETLTKKVA